MTTMKSEAKLCVHCGKPSDLRFGTLELCDKCWRAGKPGCGYFPFGRPLHVPRSVIVDADKVLIDAVRPNGPKAMFGRMD